MSAQAPFKISDKKPYVNTAQKGSSENNCALCAAAGAVNLNVGHSIWTSGMVAESMNDSTGKLGKGEAEQAKNIQEFVHSMTGRTCEQFGSAGAEMPYISASKWMGNFPDKTIFAIMATGNVKRGFDERDKQVKRVCHWLNAIKADGTLRYFDFQSNRAGSNHVGTKNPASSTAPFVGVKTQELTLSSRTLHLEQQPGSLLELHNATCIVLAFRPN